MLFVWAFALAALVAVDAQTTLTLPPLPQLTSHDETVQCQPYQFPQDLSKGYPPIWGTDATAGGIAQSAEFLALKASIDWTKVPNIPPKKKNPDGTFDLASYNVAQDPDCWWTASLCVTPKSPNINPDIFECKEPETWGLTFDDGPNCSHNAFYDYLRDQNQKATMYYIGSNVVDWPYGAQRGLIDGHELAIHTWAHLQMTTLTNDQVLAELYYTQKIIKQVTGVTPLTWRPPFGDIDDRVRAIATQLGLTAVLWRDDTDDWNMIPTGSFTRQQVENRFNAFIQKGVNGTYSQSGTIVLEHELNSVTMGLFMEFYPQIKKAYKNIVPVATCMNISQPYKEKQVTYPTFTQLAGTVKAAGANVNATGTPSSSAPASSSSSSFLSLVSVGLLSFLFLSRD